MNLDKKPLSATGRPVEAGSDHSKLVSLLALAAGAAAIPQTSNADIIFTDQNATVSWGGSHSFVISNLPGDAQLTFSAHQSGDTGVDLSRWVDADNKSAGYLRFKFPAASQSLVWDQVVGTVLKHVTFATAFSSSVNGNSFSGRYLAFEFADSSQAGSPLRYGWIGLSLAVGQLTGGHDYPVLNIQGWAYDNTGAQIPMGAKAAVPEPSATALLVLGALAFGANGVRSWRRNRAAANPS